MFVHACVCVCCFHVCVVRCVCVCVHSVSITRRVSAISITLSRDQLDSSQPG